MKNNDALKKHHFWILFGIVPLFSLIGVQCVSSNVGGSIDARKKKIDDAGKAIAQKQNPKPNSLIKSADGLLDAVGKKSGVLHSFNWERQKERDLYAWPKGSELLQRIGEKNLRFGAPLPTDLGQFDEFRKSEVYINEFESVRKDGTGMVDKVAPTQFKGGWRSVLRYVNDFGQNNLYNDQVWLIMEDIWVQRSLLDAVRSVNAEMATFHRAVVNNKGDVVDDPTFDDKGQKFAPGRDKDGKPTAGTPIPTPDNEKRKALFHNRTWKLELELVSEAGGQKRLTGTLSNMSERLQLLGSGNMMTLNVWFSREELPMVFRIGGEFLAGKGATKPGRDGRDVPADVLTVVPTEAHVVPAGKTANEILRVEQVFDVRTVPIKRIDALVLGKNDSRTGDAKQLLPPGPPFKEEPATPTADAGTGAGVTGAGVTGGQVTGGKPSGGPGFATSGPGGPGGTGGAGATAVPGGGGPLAVVIDGNKRRYLPDGVTQQVRRMPVGIVVVVDQSYIQDVLLAFANSPLRFQITQVAWTRFRANDLETGTSGSAGDTGGGVVEGKGNNNVTGPSDPDSIGGGNLPGKKKPGFPGFGMPGSGPVTGPGPTGPTGPGSIGGSGAPSSIASESQITSGLVELSIYGVVSLYEKFAADPQTAGAAAPGSGAPGPTAPATGMPGAPMNPTPPATKNRRRRVRA